MPRPPAHSPRSDGKQPSKKRLKLSGGKRSPALQSATETLRAGKAGKSAGGTAAQMLKTPPQAQPQPLCSPAASSGPSTSGRARRPKRDKPKKDRDRRGETLASHSEGPVPRGKETGSTATIAQPQGGQLFSEAGSAARLPRGRGPPQPSCDAGGATATPMAVARASAAAAGVPQLTPPDPIENNDDRVMMEVDTTVGEVGTMVEDANSAIGVPPPAVPESLYSPAERAALDAGEWTPTRARGAPTVAVGWEVAAAAAAKVAAKAATAKAAAATKMANETARKHSGEEGLREARSNGTPVADGVADEGVFVKEGTGYDGTEGGAKQTGGAPEGDPGLEQSSLMSAEGIAATVNAAETWSGTEASRLKRDAQQAKKRSWDDFAEGDGGVAVNVARDGDKATATASAMAAAAAAGWHPKCDTGSINGKQGPPLTTSVGSEASGKPKPPVPSAPSHEPTIDDNRGDSSSVPSSINPGPPSPPSPSRVPFATATAKAGHSARAEAEGSLVGSRADHSAQHSCGASDIAVAKAAAMPHAATPAATVATLRADTPDIAAARAALEAAEAVVGIDLPSQDKGPPDAEATCLLCPVPRGAFLRAERATKGAPLAWCHTLCAFSKGLLIEDRVVKVRVSWRGGGIGEGLCKYAKQGDLREIWLFVDGHATLWHWLISEIPCRSECSSPGLLCRP